MIIVDGNRSDIDEDSNESGGRMLVGICGNRIFHSNNI